VREVFAAFEDCPASAKLLLVDACRSGPVKAGRKLDVDSVPRPAQGTAALFSVSSGESAWESGKLKHSIFFHFVLEGLRGQAKDRKGAVSWHNLVGYVTEQVADEAPRLLASGAKQTPHQVANLRGKSPVLIGAGGTVAEGGTGLKRELAMDARVRGVGESTFSSKTKAFGLEVYTDGRTGHAVYISSSGSVAAVPGRWFERAGTGPLLVSQYGNELRVRAFGEEVAPQQGQQAASASRRTRTATATCSTSRTSATSAWSRRAMRWRRRPSGKGARTSTGST